MQKDLVEGQGKVWMLITHGCQMAQTNTEPNGQGGGACHITPSFICDCYDTQNQLECSEEFNANTLTCRNIFVDLKHTHKHYLIIAELSKISTNSETSYNYFKAHTSQLY